MIADYFAPFLSKISLSFRNLVLSETGYINGKHQKYTLNEILGFKLLNITSIT